LQAPDLVRLLFLFDKKSLIIAFRTLLRLATPFFFISTFFTVPDHHTKLLSFEDDMVLKPVSAKLSSPLYKGTAITKVFCAIRHNIAVMANIPGVIRSDSNFIM